MRIGVVTRGGIVSISIRSAARTILPSLIILSSGILLTAARTPAQGDACSLLTREDAATALGETAKGPNATAPMSDGAGATVSACEYTGSGIHAIQLNLYRLTASSTQMYKGMCAKKNKEGLAGLGDVACWYNDKHAELHVVKGTAFLSMDLRRNGDPTEPIKVVMKKALERLK